MAGTLAVVSRYGNFELKRAYRKNMIIGILTASLFLLTSIGGWAMFGDINLEPAPFEDGGMAVIPDTVEIIILPPPGPTGPPPTEGPILPEDLSIGTPIPLDDSLVTEENDMPTNREIELIISSRQLKSLEQIGNGPIVLKAPEQFYPKPGEFVFYEEKPILIENIQPIYPEMARRAGIEGVVWVNVLISSDGSVRDVKIIKDSDANAGFEEAAIDAAMQSTWKPAISNGRPVAVWTAYKVQFILN
ncbi:MAG: energy transducer TonB [candidate division Zixibacteria bacterium]|nr:energy transducer TonB [candidate division Zixibacteria bacterium]